MYFFNNCIKKFKLVKIGVSDSLIFYHFSQNLILKVIYPNHVDENKK